MSGPHQAHRRSHLKRCFSHTCSDCSRHYYRRTPPSSGPFASEATARGRRAFSNLARLAFHQRSDESKLVIRLLYRLAWCHPVAIHELRGLSHPVADDVRTLLHLVVNGARPFSELFPMSRDVVRTICHAWEVDGWRQGRANP